MKHRQSIILGTFSALLSSVSAFAPSLLNGSSIRYSSTSTTTSKSMLPEAVNMIDDQQISALASASYTFLSTIDGDIDSISNDEFGTVFAGGIAVMFGGVLSCLMVGLLLESGNSYANVVADSYAQGGDEEFWESLSPEDQVKTRELLDKLKKSKEKGGNAADAAAVAMPSTTTDASVGTTTSTDSTDKKKKEEFAMFSDYDD